MDCKDLPGFDEAAYARITSELRGQPIHTGGRTEGLLRFNLDLPLVAVVDYRHPQTRIAYQVRSVDISSRVLRFLHGRLERLDTPIVAILRDTSGDLRKMGGVVTHTRLVTGRIHVVEMRFDQEIDPSVFVSLQGLSDDQKRHVSVWQQNWKSLIRLEDQALVRLMEQVQDRDDREEFRAQRHSVRMIYRQGAILVVLNPADAVRWSVFRVPTIDLSASGIGFLHGAFVHPGTPCDVVLTDMYGRTEIVHGEVARCELAKGRVHQVGVRFEEPIETSRFMSCDELNEADAA